MIKESSKVLLLWDRLGEYHRARWKALQSKFGQSNILAADLSSADDLYQWENTSDTEYYFRLSNRSIDQSDFFNRVGNFYRLVRNEKINMVIQAGYGRIEYLVFIILSKLSGKKVILFAESWYPGAWLFDKVKSFFLKNFVDGLFVSGCRAEFHFSKRLGIPRGKIIKGYSVVDNDHFNSTRSSPPSLEFHRSGKSEGQGRFIFSSNHHVTTTTLSPIDPLSFQPYLLCVARYSKEKNLPFLINAYKNSKLYNNWKLVLIGDGPQREELAYLVQQENEIIILAGWKNYGELPNWYCHAKAFILPSIFEPWGLAVNEAMASGLPVLVSKNCGCCEDLVINGENGYIFDPDDVRDLVNKMNSIYLLKDDQLVLLKKKSKDTISFYNLKSWVENLERFINA